jgi:hypothetical protein
LVKPPPQTQPKAKTDEGPQIDAALSVSEEPETKAEPLVPLGFTQSPTIAPAAYEGALCLDPATPFDNAQKLVSSRAWHPVECIRTWQFWQKSFWQWTGTHWQEVDDDTVRASMWHELNGAEKVLKGGKRARYEPRMNDVNATLDALKAAVNLPALEENAMPGWFRLRVGRLAVPPTAVCPLTNAPRLLPLPLWAKALVLALVAQTFSSTLAPLPQRLVFVLLAFGFLSSIQLRLKRI